MPDLGSLGLQIKAHWKRHRPKLCAELEREGALDEAVATAADLTRDALAHLISDKGIALRPGVGAGPRGVGVRAGRRIGVLDDESHSKYRRLARLQRGHADR